MAGNVQEELTRILQKMQASGVEQVWLSPENVAALKNAVPGQTLARATQPMATCGAQPSQPVAQPAFSPTMQPPAFSMPVPPPSSPAQPVPPVQAPAVKTNLPGDFAAKVAAADWTTLEGMVKECRYCPLRGTCQHPLFLAGQRKARVVFIGDFPFAEEETTGVPFAGLAGEMLKKMGIAMKLNWEHGEPGAAVVNLLKCRPSAPPEQESFDICGHYLRRQLTLLAPEYIVLLGNLPLKILAGISGFSSYKGKWLQVGATPAMLIQNPATIMRYANNQAMFVEERRQAWNALQEVMARLV